MLLNRQIIAASTSVNRSLSLSALRFVDVPSSKPLSEERKTELEESRKRMIWRLKPTDRVDQWYSKFKLFTDKDDDATSESLMAKLQKPIDMRPSSISNWISKTYEKRDRYMQQFIPQRHEILGNDLACAHFIVYRQGRVKFQDQDKWIKMDEDNNIPLPNKYVHGMFLEAVDCEGVSLYYEGLENIRRLRELKYISFKNVKSFDDWCLDRVSGSEFDKLEVLDLSGTNITYRGIQALYRVPSLKKLILDDPYRDTEWKLTLAMLQEVIFNLEIVETNSLDKSVEK